MSSNTPQASQVTYHPSGGGTPVSVSQALESLNITLGLDVIAITNSIANEATTRSNAIAAINANITADELAQSFQTLVDLGGPGAGSVVWDFPLGNIAKFTLTSPTTINNPTHIKAGGYTLILAQDATGSRTVTWGSVFKWPSGVAPVLSTVANSIDVISFVCDGTNMYGSYVRGMQ